jgi:large subunit ribosomal protein L6
MSKCGRKPIYFKSVSVKVNDNTVSYSGKEATGIYEVPKELFLKFDDEKITLMPKEEFSKVKYINKIWGLHRAILNNLISGARKKFEKKLIIEGLGFKVQNNGSNLTFSLGFSHKIDYILPKNVSLEIDKTGQQLILHSFDKDLLGSVCSKIRSFRPPEPYKGKGIRISDEIIKRKTGKAKS